MEEWFALRFWTWFWIYWSWAAGTGVVAQQVEMGSVFAELVLGLPLGWVAMGAEDGLGLLW